MSHCVESWSGVLDSSGDKFWGDLVGFTKMFKTGEIQAISYQHTSNILFYYTCVVVKFHHTGRIYISIRHSQQRNTFMKNQSLNLGFESRELRSAWSDTPSDHSSLDHQVKFTVQWGVGVKFL